MTMHSARLCVALVLGILIAGAFAVSEVQFEQVVIDNDFQGDYGLHTVDINADGKIDVLAYAWGTGVIAWYENPSWQKRVINVLPGVVAIDFGDVDGDGKQDLIVAYKLAVPPVKEDDGMAAWLKQPADLNTPWTGYHFATLSGLHRILYGEFFYGMPAALAIPLFNPGGKFPFVDKTAKIRMYVRPDDLKHSWKTIEIDDSLHIIHSALRLPKTAPAPGNGSVLIGSMEGITLMSFDSRTHKVSKSLLARGVPPSDYTPYTGSNNAVVGKIQNNEYAFIASMGPWEGTTLLSAPTVQVMYPGNSSSAQAIFNPPLRSFDLDVLGPQGHTLITGDFNGDKNDDILIGLRGPMKGVYLYQMEVNATSPLPSWHKYQVAGTASTYDGQLGSSYLGAADFDGDGRLDFASTGFAPFGDHFVALYINKGVTEKN